MTKLLTICIPTYKRPETLRRCIDSVAHQIENFEFTGCIDLHVANDASPDDTKAVLHAYEKLDYFSGVTREHNLGMSANIRIMLNEAAKKSTFQLILTDDDYLQPNILDEVVVFLRKLQSEHNNVPVIWTPRFSYTTDGHLHCVVCNPFKDSYLVKPSVSNAGKYMNNGFVLSGIILRAECIDSEFWEQYSENAYFPMILFGELLIRSGAYYWNSNIVHHTVLNECHWERWGENDIVIALRLFADYIKAYGFMAEKAKGGFQSASFYLSSFSSIRARINLFMMSGKFSGHEPNIASAIHELNDQGVLRYTPQLRILVLCALPAITMASLRNIIRSNIAMLILKKQNREEYRRASASHMDSLRTLPIIFRLFFPGAPHPKPEANCE